METIQWNENYSVGNQSIDSQHIKLIEMINEMAGLWGSSIDSEEISTILSEMTEYASSHFNYEEAYMEQIGYPGLKDHKKEHKEFKLRVCDFCMRIMHKDNLVPEEILLFLSKWLINHILHSDMKYKMFSDN